MITIHRHRDIHICPPPWGNMEIQTLGNMTLREIINPCVGIKLYLDSYYWFANRFKKCLYTTKLKAFKLKKYSDRNVPGRMEI